VAAALPLSRRLPRSQLERVGVLDPIPFGQDGAAAHEQSGWSFRVVEEGPELVLQTLADGAWSDV
jgi:hypothetical protein